MSDSDNGITKTYSLLFIIFVAGCLTSCGNKTAENRSAPQKGQSSTKYDQYFVHGEVLYQQHCSNCHQATGTGLGRVYPPLAKSDYMMANLDSVVCLIRNGKDGELVVNGTSYNQRMPEIPSLTDIEIAQITTYIYNSWGNEHGIVEVNDVSRILLSCQ